LDLLEKIRRNKIKHKFKKIKRNFRSGFPIVKMKEGFMKFFKRFSIINGTLNKGPLKHLRWLIAAICRSLFLPCPAQQQIEHGQAKYLELKNKVGTNPFRPY